MEVTSNCEKTMAGGGWFPPPKALVVVECPRDLGYYSATLEAYGYQVRGCSTYGEGVRCLGNEDFDFVIVSQGSSKFEGGCVLKRAIEIDHHLPVLVVSRCLDMGCYLEAIQLGAKDYLVQPLTAWEIGRLLPAQPWPSHAA